MSERLSWQPESGDDALNDLLAAAPVIELVAEMRWVDVESIYNTPQQTLLFPSTDFEVAHGKLQQALASRGFHSSERVVPPGVGVPANTVVYRYRNFDTGLVVMVGPGVFSVNATPPYRGWPNFEVALRQCLKDILTIGQGIFVGVPVKPTRSVTVRYINAFRTFPEALADPRNFLQNMLGFKFELPVAFDQHVDKNVVQHVKQEFRVGVAGGEMAVNVGTGRINNEPTHVPILDWSVALYKVKVDEDSVVNAFVRAHDVLHDIFMKLTSGLRGQMPANQLH